MHGAWCGVWDVGCSVRAQGEEEVLIPSVHSYSYLRWQWRAYAPTPTCVGSGAPMRGAGDSTSVTGGLRSTMMG